MGFFPVVVAIVVLPLGFLAGMLTFRRSQRWCPECGALLTCPDCAAVHRAIRPRNAGSFDRTDAG